MTEVWDDAIDGVVGEMLRDASWKEPPVDVIELAETLEVSVFEQEQMEVRGKLIRQETGRDVIVVRAESWEERSQYSVAHELGERYAEAVCLRAGEDFESLTARFVEELAHRFAHRLLCPDPDFRRDAATCGYDLYELKEKYETASHEVIAYRMLHVDIPTVVTVLDNERLARRDANFSGFRFRELEPFEEEVWQKAHKSGQPESECRGNVFVQAWPVWEDGFKREILRTSAEEY